MLADKLRTATIEGLTYVGGYAQYIGAVPGTTTFPLNSLTGGIDTAARAGDLVLLFQTRSEFNSTASPTVPAGYTTLSRSLVGGSDYRVGWMLVYKLLSAADTSVDLANSSSYFSAALVQVWRGVDSATPASSTSVASTISSSRSDPPSVTPTVAGSIVSAFGGNAAGGTADLIPPGSLSAGFTVGGTGTAVAAGYIPWITGSVDPSPFGAINDITSYSAVGISVVINPA